MLWQAVQIRGSLRCRRATFTCTRAALCLAWSWLTYNSELQQLRPSVSTSTSTFATATSVT
jgi:hypothetical protein